MPTADPPTSVTFYFDYVSAYSWLALERAEAFAIEHGVAWRVRPMLFPAVLEVANRLGTGQIPVLREYSMLDLAREARHLGIDFVGPPVHPFVSLRPLRAVVAHQDEPSALALARAIAHRTWSLGEDATDWATLERAFADVGRTDDRAAIRATCSDSTTKAALRANTDEAIAAGVFGAPTFVLDGELFWGQDRLPALARRIAGEPRPQPGRIALPPTPDDDAS